MSGHLQRRIELYDRRVVRHVAPCLGFEPEQLKREEDPAAIKVRSEDDVDPADTPLRHLAQGDLDRWFRLFGRALEIRVEVRAGEPVDPWTADASGHDAADLARLIREAEQRTDARLDVHLTVEKAFLVERLRQDLHRDVGPPGRDPAPGEAAPADLAVHFFFFAAAFEDSLEKRDELGFEKTFLAPCRGARLRPLLVLLGDEPGRLRGPYLAVLGGADVGKAPVFVAGAAATEPLGERWEVMKDECQWDQRTRCLTPDFLELDDWQGLAGCRRQLLRLTDRLVLPFLADTTNRSDPGELECEFKGERRQATFLTGVEQGSESAAVKQGPQSAEERSKAFLALYRWAYESPREAGSRLAIVRRLIAAKEWLPAPSFALLVDSAPALREQCVYQLRLLIEDNVFETFRERQKIADRIRAYTDGVGDRIRGLSKEMVDNTYRTVGLLVAIALAYIFDPGLGPTMGMIGAGLYVVYILFVYFFYVRALNADFEEKQAEFEHEKKRLKDEEIGALDELFEGVTARENAFKGRFWTVTAIYALLVVLAILLGIWLGGDRPDLWLQDPRARALEVQASRFKAMGFRDLRLDLAGHQRPDQWVDETTGTTVLGDLTAIGPDDRLRLVVYLPCDGIEDPAQRDRLSRLRRAGASHHAEVQLLTEAVCDGEPGHERLRRLLEREGVGPLPIWSR